MQALSHDRSVDRRPASRGYTSTGLVLGSDVSCPVQIGMQLEATSSAPEPSTRASVVAGDVPAATTRLRGMPGIDPDHRTAALLCLVLDERTKLVKAPAMKTPGLLSFTHLGSHSDVLQVFDDDRGTGTHSSNDLLRDDVITISTKSSLLAPQFPQMTLSGLRVLGLQGSFQLEDPGLDVAPSPLAQELIVRCDSRLDYAEVHADDLVGWCDFGCGHDHHDVQQPATIALDEVGCCCLEPDKLLAVVRNDDGDCQSACYCREFNFAGGPVELEGMHVESRRTARRLRTRNLAPLFVQAQCALDGLCGFDTRLDVQVTNESREPIFERAICGVVERNTILLVVLPSVGAHDVEGFSELIGCFDKSFNLDWGRLEYEANRSIHTMNLPYTLPFGKKGDGNSSAS
jgi:hypothetical protein